jgi:aminopeptidase N
MERKYLLLTSPIIAWFCYEAYNHSKIKKNHLTGTIPLKKEEGEKRGTNIKNIYYEVSLNLTELKRFSGTITIKFDLSNKDEILFLDYMGDIKQIDINGNKGVGYSHKANRIILKNEHLIIGVNEIKIEFKSHYSDHSDKILGLMNHNGVIVSNCEPFYTNRIFPCFDQPSMRATFELSVYTKPDIDLYFCSNKNNEVQEDTYGNKLYTFQTVNIPPHQFLIVGGHFMSTTDYRNKSYSVDLNVHTHRYIKHDVNLINLYLVIRKSIEWFEKTFVTTFPGKKIDIVFLPDYYVTANSAPGIIILDKSYIEKNTDKLDIGYFNYTVVVQIFSQWIGSVISPKWWDDSAVYEGINLFLADLFFNKNEVT